jgi:uncharacterized protein YggU (UPF0235/DUF167 family)
MSLLPIKLQPGAASDRIDGWDSDPSGRAVLKIRLRARPIEGQANDALLKFLAHALDLPKSTVSLARGTQSRLKMVEIAGLDDSALRTRIDAILR